jgi:hypothetical protein
MLVYDAVDFLHLSQDELISQSVNTARHSNLRFADFDRLISTHTDACLGSRLTGLHSLERGHRSQPLGLSSARTRLPSAAYTAWAMANK